PSALRPPAPRSAAARLPAVLSSAPREPRGPAAPPSACPVASGSGQARSSTRPWPHSAAHRYPVALHSAWCSALRHWPEPPAEQQVCCSACSSRSSRLSLKGWPLRSQPTVRRNTFWEFLEPFRRSYVSPLPFGSPYDGPLPGSARYSSLGG